MYIDQMYIERPIPSEIDRSRANRAPMAKNTVYDLRCVNNRWYVEASNTAEKKDLGRDKTFVSPEAMKGFRKSNLDFSKKRIR